MNTYVYTYINISSVYQLIHAWGFLLQAIVNNFVMNIFLSSGQTPNGRIPGLEDNPMFNLLKNCQIIFHSDCNILCYHNHQQWGRVPISATLSHTCHDLFPGPNFKNAILVLWSDVLLWWHWAWFHVLIAQAFQILYTCFKRNKWSSSSSSSSSSA